MELRAAGRALALGTALVGGCRVGPALEPPPAPPVAVLPFDPYGGGIYVLGVINGDSAWLMFDTGLSHTGFDREWAALGGAAVTRRETPGGAASVVVDRLRLGDLELRNYSSALYSLRGLSEASGRLERGLVGHDVLERFTVEIDYPALRIRLFDPVHYRYAGSGHAVAFTPDADLPLLQAALKIRGRRAIPARLLLDTGASGLCLILTAPFVAEHDLAQLSPAIAAPIGTGLAGDLPGTIVRLQELRLGSLKVPSPTTGLGGASKGFLGRTDIDGVISNAVFEGSRLIVDYVGRRVFIEPGPSAGARCDYDMSGLRLAARGAGLTHLVVDYVVPRSPSGDAGIWVGDELLRLDDRPVAGADLSAVRQALRVDGAVRRLVLRRAADTIHVALRLRRLL